ncbi:MAG: UvrD-helicase domain-containing protein [Bacteroidota bacterium]
MITLVDQVRQQGLRIYKSSAGSGKTYHLVKAYLTLLLSNPYQYRHILAITFTNKATEEMKRRILGKLKEFSTLPADALLEEPMYQEISALYRQYIPEGSLELQSRSRKALELILNDYSNFSVSTIESFFQRIVRAFTRELNIPLGYEVELSQHLVLDELLREMLSEIGHNQELTRLFKKFLTYNLQESRSWNLDWAIRKLGYQVFQERFQQLTIRSPLLENHIDQILSLAESLQVACKRFETRMSTPAIQGLEIMKDLGLEVEDFKYGKGGVAGYFYRVVDKKEYDPKKRARDAVGDPRVWMKKGSQREEDIEQALADGLQECLLEMVGTFDAEYEDYQTAVVASKTLYTFGMMYDLQRKLTEYRREHRQLVISDTSYLLSLIIEGVQQDIGLDTPFIYERVGTRYHHYLLDEFQDTSTMQWRNLFPLLKESLSEIHTNLIVGDVKQSIYRWRNGNMDLLMRKVEEQVKRETGQEPQIVLLKDNWRTVPEIVDFNNSFFAISHKRLANELGEWADPELSKAYESLVQNPQRKNRQGMVQVDFILNERNSEVPWTEKAMELCEKRIRSVLGQGFMGGEISVLVRNNREGVALAQYLQKREIKVVSAESLLLMRNPKVVLLHAALLNLVEEEDAIAWATLQYYWNQLVSKQELNHQTFSRTEIPEIEEFLSDKLSLQRLPVYECVATLIKRIPGFHTADAYVLAFLEVVNEYTHLVDASISGFLTWWEEQKHKRAISSGQENDAVKIMTIHKSKGLEFPVVILPFADWPLEPKSGEFLWIEQPPEGLYQQLPYMPIQVSTRLEESLFQGAYRKERLMSFVDNLNLLYVAFTRPQYRLYVQTCHTGKSPSSIKRISQLLETGIRTLQEENPSLVSLNRKEGMELEGFWSYQFGKEVAASSPSNAMASHLQKLPDLAVSTGSPFPNISIRYHAGNYFSANLRKQSERMLRGELLHEALGLVVGLADIPVAVSTMLHKGYISSEEAELLKNTLLEVISLPEVADWYAGNWKVKNEADILTAEGSLLRPDRVMIQGSKAVVVDYKTGAPFDSHKIQVLTYMQALSQMGYKEVSGFLYYLQDKVVEVRK